MSEQNLLWEYGKVGEKIVYELFKEMGFEVSNIGVEYRREQKQEIFGEDIYSPDLKLFDSEREEEFYIEVKTLIISNDNKFTIDEELLENYYRYYPYNSFVVLYLPEKNRIGMCSIEEMKKWSLKSPLKRRIILKNKKVIYCFDFELFDKINHYGKNRLFSRKFLWNTKDDKQFDDKTVSFLESKQDEILPYFNGMKLFKKHKIDWKQHNVFFKKRSSLK